MPIDAYTLCPGGTGKSMKFCCKDLMHDLDQVDQMLEGQQYHAALAKIEQLMAQKPDRACLMELKAQLLRATEQTDGLPELVDRYVEKYPTNPVALAERAMLVAEDKGGREGMAALQAAIEASSEGFQNRLYDAMGVVAHALLTDGQIMAARAVYYLQTIVRHDEPQPVEAILRLNASPQIPLLLKDDATLQPKTEGAPWAADYDAATVHMNHGRWRKAAEVFTRLVERWPDSPVLWHNLATLRTWLADSSGAADALRKLATLDIPLEDAVEAQATAMLMSPDSLGDEIDVIGVTYPIDDVDQVQSALAGTAEVSMMPVDPATIRREGPPPRSLCTFLDRAKLRDDETQFTVENIPHVLGQGLLYGRETDKAARLDFPAISVHRWEAVKALLARVAPPTQADAIETRKVGRISQSRELLRPDWSLPRGADPGQAEEAVGRLQREAIVDRWPQLALGLLDGKTPAAAAGDPALKVKLLAAVLLLQSWYDTMGEQFEFNLLRAKLGLPTLGPIDPAGVAFGEIPLVRLHRLEIEKLNNESLVFAYRRALSFAVPRALPKLAREVVDRPGLEAPEEKSAAFRHLAETEENVDRALEYVERGRQATVKAGKSCASWDFMEITLRLERGEAERFGALVNHIQSKHIREPGVAASLMQLLVQVGVLNPDGTPAVPPGGMPAEAALGPAAAEPGKLWTPDGGGSAHGQPSKLWTPD